MYTYETFLANQKKDNSNDRYKKMQINTVESDRKQSTASISDYSSGNKGKNCQMKYSHDNHDIEIEKLKEIYNSKKNELENLKNKYKELKKEYFKKSNKLSNIYNKYIYEKDNNNNLRKIIIQTYGNK